MSEKIGNSFFGVHCTYKMKNYNLYEKLSKLHIVTYIIRGLYIYPLSFKRAACAADLVYIQDLASIV